MSMAHGLSAGGVTIVGLARRWRIDPLGSFTRHVYLMKMSTNEPTVGSSWVMSCYPYLA